MEVVKLAIVGLDGPFSVFGCEVFLTLAALQVQRGARLLYTKRCLHRQNFNSTHTAHAMIRFILLQNRAGKTRLAKYYIPLDDSEKHSLEYEVHRLIATRDPKFTNFVEVRRGLMV